MAIVCLNMTDPILLACEHPRQWCGNLARAPIGPDLKLDTGDDVIDGWASRRFLGGALTFWAWCEGRVRFVQPLAWSIR